MSATSNPRIAAPVVRAITIQTLSNRIGRFCDGFVPTCARQYFYSTGASDIANTDDKRQSAQVSLQKTRDFGQKDGETGAPLHHSCRKFDV
ncbi:hypothetical protein [Ruegeria arenilitoris]|uniref:hypothetical protein n=1 Tax=Ruegeria arenilitoris TaxID=1173585 RepID=UPI00147F9C18|nr:hypothetical protein [Ruegeria arenilitoris]